MRVQRVEQEMRVELVAQHGQLGGATPGFQAASSCSIWSSSSMKKLIPNNRARTRREQSEVEQDRAEETTPVGSSSGLTKVAMLQVSMTEKTPDASDDDRRRDGPK